MDFVNEVHVIEDDIEDVEKNAIKFNAAVCMMHSKQLLN